MTNYVTRRDTALLEVMSMVREAANTSSPDSTPIHYHFITALTDVIKEVKINGNRTHESGSRIFEVLIFLAKNKIRTVSELFQIYSSLYAESNYIMKADDFSATLTRPDEYDNGVLRIHQSDFVTAVMTVLDPLDYLDDRNTVNWKKIYDLLMEITLTQGIWNAPELRIKDLQHALSGLVKSQLVTVPGVMKIVTVDALEHVAASVLPRLYQVAAINQVNKVESKPVDVVNTDQAYMANNVGALDNVNIYVLALIMNTLLAANSEGLIRRYRTALDLYELIEIVLINQDLSPSLVLSMVKED